MKYICAVMIFVELASVSLAQRDTYILILNKYDRGHGYQFQYIKNHNNNNPLSNGTSRNFRFTAQSQFKNDTATQQQQQQQVLEKLNNLLIDIIDKGANQPSPAAILARQRPFALVSPKSQFLRCIANCPTTNQYNPVCGSDHQTYHNEYKLQCAIRCGKTVRLSMLGICPLNF